jgi:flagellar hook-length control protein FliK
LATPAVPPSISTTPQTVTPQIAGLNPPLQFAEPLKSPGQFGIPTVGQDNAQVLTTMSTPSFSTNSSDTQQTVNALTQQLVSPATGSVHQPRQSETQASIVAGLAHAQHLSTGSELPADTSILPSALLSAGTNDLLLRPIERSSRKTFGLPTGAGSEGTWRATDVLAGSSMMVSPPLVDSTGQSPESMVASTVSYWAAQGIQNAELKFDGFDEPVQVSISLNGDEARVVFRTDQPEIRQLLEGASAQLKDMLGGEGLVLSGVSVGSSGQNEGGAQGQREHPEAPRASIPIPVGTPVKRGQGLNTSVGQAVDLFV